jgi:hypothetical protein
MLASARGREVNQTAPRPPAQEALSRRGRSSTSLSSLSKRQGVIHTPEATEASPVVLALIHPTYTGMTAHTTAAATTVARPREAKVATETTQRTSVRYKEASTEAEPGLVGETRHFVLSQ